MHVFFGDITDLRTDVTQGSYLNNLTTNLTKFSDILRNTLAESQTGR